MKNEIIRLPSINQEIDRLAKRDIKASHKLREEFEASLNQEQLALCRKLRAEFRLRGDSGDFEVDEIDKDDLAEVVSPWCDKWAEELLAKGWWLNYLTTSPKIFNPITEDDLSRLYSKDKPRNWKGRKRWRSTNGVFDGFTREVWFDGQEILSVSLVCRFEGDWLPSYNTPTFSADLGSYGGGDVIWKTPKDALASALTDALKEFYCGSS